MFLISKWVPFLALYPPPFLLIRGEAAGKVLPFLLILGQKQNFSEFKTHVLIIPPFYFRIRLFEEGGFIKQEKVCDKKSSKTKWSYFLKCTNLCDFYYNDLRWNIELSADVMASENITFCFASSVKIHCHPVGWKTSFRQTLNLFCFSRSLNFARFVLRNVKLEH